MCVGYSNSKWDDIDIDTRVYGSPAKYPLNPPSYVAPGNAILRDPTSEYNNADEPGIMVEHNVHDALSFPRNRNQPEYTLDSAANARLPLAYPGADARKVQMLWCVDSRLQRRAWRDTRATGMSKARPWC